MEFVKKLFFKKFKYSKKDEDGKLDIKIDVDLGIIWIFLGIFIIIKLIFK